MSKKQAVGKQTRERLIDAAMHTMLTQGITGLTLDEVAKEAGVSKGGLLHHFPSKDALVEAILRQLFNEFDTRVQAHYVAETGGWLRAYIRATFDDDVLPLELAAILLVSIAENASLMQIIRDDFHHWQARLLNDGIPPARAQIIRQAADAYWMERLMGVAPQSHEERFSLMHELLSLVKVEPA